VRPPAVIVGALLLALLITWPLATAMAGPRGSLASFSEARKGMRRGASCGIFSIKPRLLLDPVTAQELTGCGRNEALAGGDFRFGGAAFRALNLRHEVTRTVADLWRLRLPPEARLFALDVSYELVGANGRASRLCSPGKNESEIKVVIDEIPPRVIGRETSSVVIEGGMTMRLQLESVRSAGKYSGTLTVVVNHF